MRKKHRSQRLNFARNMPPLYHTLPGEEFDYKKSQVLRWLSERPELLLYLFDVVSNHEIVYNPDTGKWQGVDYED